MGKQTTHGPQMGRREEETKGTIMPNVGGKKYPYTKAGKAAAKKAAKKQTAKKATKKKGMYLGG